jgi:2'-hydroxyisoflavone reductase
MRVLILGGTSFVGRAIAGATIARGFEVTLFNRGRTSPPGPVPQLIDDRDTGDYTALRDGPGWAAVVDVSGYFPWQVAGAMDALGDRAGRYLFVSSHAVFDGGSDARRAPIRDARPPLTDDTYGPSKVACEDDVLARHGDRATIVRPCARLGPRARRAAAGPRLHRRPGTPAAIRLTGTRWGRCRWSRRCRRAPASW